MIVATFIHCSIGNSLARFGRKQTSNARSQLTVAGDNAETLIIYFRKWPVLRQSRSTDFEVIRGQSQKGSQIRCQRSRSEQIGRRGDQKAECGVFGNDEQIIRLGPRRTRIACLGLH